jgi:hypothetical protein
LRRYDGDKGSLLRISGKGAPSLPGYAPLTSEEENADSFPAFLRVFFLPSHAPLQKGKSGCIINDAPVIKRAEIHINLRANVGFCSPHDEGKSFAFG